MTMAGLLAYVLAELFTLPQGYWAVFSAIIVMQASVGGSVKATIDRVIGTIGGAVAGGAVGFVVPHQNVFSLGMALVIALVPLTLVAALWPNYRVAPLTAVIVLLTPGAEQLGPVSSAFYRIVEITVGSLVGLGVSLVLLPARAHGLVISTAARALSLLADLLGDWFAVLAGGWDRTRITQLQDDIRAAVARLEIVAGEVHQERRTYLTHEFDPDPLVRAVFRLRNDVVMIGAQQPSPCLNRSVRACMLRSNKSPRSHNTFCARAPTRYASARARQLLTQPSRRSLILPRLSRSYGVTVLREYYP
jgi:Fusaric acid resistance protein-like